MAPRRNHARKCQKIALARELSSRAGPSNITMDRARGGFFVCRARGRLFQIFTVRVTMDRARDGFMI